MTVIAGAWWSYGKKKGKKSEKKKKEKKKKKKKKENLPCSEKEKEKEKKPHTPSFAHPQTFPNHKRAGHGHCPHAMV